MKNKIRESIRKYKINITDNQKESDGLAVFNRIETLQQFKEAKTVLLYWSLNDELPTHKFVEKWSKLKQVLLPIVQGDKMTIGKYESTMDMNVGDFGILEPQSIWDELEGVDLAIVPGIAFDQQKNRLGRGKGYYDQFLVHISCFKIGSGFDFQIVDKLAVESHDIKMDMVVTPSYFLE